MQRIINLILNGQDPADEKVRGRLGIISGAAGMAINGLIFIMELLVGAVVNSVAITADAFHNLTDVVSSVITVFSFRLANKPADKEHPFGHGRAEYISALIIAMVIIVIGYEFIKTSIEKILHPSPVNFSLISLILVLLAIPLKLLLSSFNKKMGRTISSSALEASSFDAFSDVLVLSVASLSLIVSAFTKLQIDGWLGALVALFIMYSGFSIAKMELNPLLGEAPEPELVKKIIDGVLETNYVSGVHDLIIHNYGPGKFMASIHAEVPCDVPILRIHDEIDRTEKFLSDKLGIILVIHMDPLNKNDEVVKSAQGIVEKVIQRFPEALSIHDFRVVGDSSVKNVIFDIVVDSSIVTKTDEEELRKKINGEIKKQNPNYNAVINVDRNYTSSEIGQD